MGVKETFLGRLLGNADKFSDEQVTQTINLLIEHGVKHRASDIHIEPHERFVRVRYRVDNALRSVHKLPLAALPAVVAQIKALAHMHPEDTHLPQDGQYATLVGEEQFEIQVHTMPVVGGEKVVMRISRRLGKPLKLDELGFWGQGLSAIQHALSRTHGLIAVATPRRNGKTTTLHSLLQLVNVPSIGVATVEDAIEYRVPDASQTLVRPQHGITFYGGLQAALNQDPNVVLISSLADKKTAELAIQAAIGGHLMITGMHADNAPAALARLQSTADEQFLFAHAVRLVISQRLVRKLCLHCRESYTPTREELAGIEKAFGINTSQAKARIHELERTAVDEGLGGNVGLHTNASGITSLWRAREEGCEACNHSGYRGSVAIVEVLEVAQGGLQTTLLTPTTTGVIRKAALKEGFIPMELDGLIKALRGQTTLPELLRVLGV